VTRWAHHPWKLPVLSGFILAFAYYPLGLVVPNLVALVPLLVWVDANLNRPWKAWRNAGFAFGLTVHLMILNWMLSMIHWSFLAIFAYLGLAFLFAVGLTLMVMAMAWTRSMTRWPWVVLLPACWLSLEWIQAQGDLRMTAQHLGQTLGTLPFLVQFADLAGPYGVGGVLLVSSALLYEAWQARSAGRRARSLGAWALMIAAVLAYDGVAWTHPPAASGTLRVSFVQPNIPLEEKRGESTDAEQTATLESLTIKAAQAKPDVVVWPETARPIPIFHVPGRPATYAMPEVQSLARQLRVTIVTGVEYLVARKGGGDDAYNAVMVVHPDGTLDPVWSAKIDLVPFVEAVPFKPIFGPFLSGRGGWMRWLAGGFLPGPDATPLPVAGARMGVTVCFEELFFDLQRGLRNAGATIQAVVTNDAWFGRAYFQPYQANAVRLRAIENRTAFVRVANTGISMFVDPLGRDYQRTALEVEAVGTMDLPLVDVRTLYDRIGDAAAYAAMAVLAAALILSWGYTR
jgi:apolipoprotein N-acyltransferase